MRRWRRAKSFPPAPFQCLVLPAGGAVFEAIPPVQGFGFAEAAELPLVVGERIDQDALLGEGGLPALVVLFGEAIKRGGIFAGNDLAFGVHAGFEGIEAGDGLAPKSTRTGGLLGVEAVGLLLFERGHSYFQAEGNRRARGGRAGGWGKWFGCSGMGKLKLG